MEGMYVCLGALIIVAPLALLVIGIVQLHQLKASVRSLVRRVGELAGPLRFGREPRRHQSRSWRNEFGHLHSAAAGWRAVTTNPQDGENRLTRVQLLVSGLNTMSYHADNLRHQLVDSEATKLMVWDELGYTGYIDLVQENKP